MCRIVLERGRNQQGEPKGQKDVVLEQGAQVGRFSSGSCFSPSTVSDSLCNLGVQLQQDVASELVDGEEFNW